MKKMMACSQSKHYRVGWWARGVAVVVLSLSLVTPSLIVQAKSSAPSLSALKGAYQKAKGQGELLQGHIESLTKQETGLSEQLSLLQQRLVTTSQQEAVAKVTFGRFRQRVESDRRRVRRTQAATVQARTRLQRQMVVWYEQGSLPYLEVLLGAKSFSDFLFRASAMTLLLQRQNQIVRADRALLRQYRALVLQATHDERQASYALLRVASLRTQVAGEAAGEQSLITRVADMKRATVLQRSDQIEAAQRLASQISAIEVAQREAATQSRGASAPPVSSQGILNASAVQADLLQATKDAGVPSTWVPWLLLLVRYESGGNAYAKSPAAVDGEYASGLLQMLPSTFSRYAQTGHEDIWNPVDNALAAIRYIKAAYGAPQNIPGISGGYRGY